MPDHPDAERTSIVRHPDNGDLVFVDRSTGRVVRGPSQPESPPHHSERVVDHGWWEEVDSCECHGNDPCAMPDCPRRVP